MAHEKQLDICALQYQIMNEKLNEIGADVKVLCDGKVKQDAINLQVLRAIEDINRRNAEQDEFNDYLSLFAWIGKNWKELMAGVLTAVGLVIAYFGLKK